MLVPLSWIKEYIDIDDIPLGELIHTITMAGLEVEEIRYLGLSMPEGKLEVHPGGHTRVETKISGLAWDPDKIVVGAILEVKPHPNADRLVLCELDDGQQVHTVLTGAPNLFEYKGSGPLKKPIKVAYARLGAQIYDGHKPGQVLTKLKRTKIRGVESSSMACSEKELGLSEEHEGIMILEDDPPVGMPLVDFMGDAILDINITPNIARNANILGVAREIAALTGREPHPPSYDFTALGDDIQGKASLEIKNPDLNPRFVLGLIRDIEIKPSPPWVQRRLTLAGMRPINNIVDATNYVMLEIGEPLHAFDYDVLVERADGKNPTIITRTAEEGEVLVTLDGEERVLNDFTVLVCDTAGALSIAGVMGGAESEVTDSTRNVLLEGAAWNFINIRRTLSVLKFDSEAAYRFSRGVHPALAERGVCRGLELMRQWSGGMVCKGLVDAYPLPPVDPTVEVTPGDVRRWLGIELTIEEMSSIFERLEFGVEAGDGVLRVSTPDHRLDIGTGVIGKADLMEEVARIYGYENIPETRMSDELPPPHYDSDLVVEERIRDTLVKLGLQEVITYRLTTERQETRRLHPDTPPDGKPYLRITNPISSERSVMRKSLLSSVMEIMERNARIRERIAIFEIGPIFLASEESPLPDELLRLVIAMTGPRTLTAWQGADTNPMNFYDLKGIVEMLLNNLGTGTSRYEPSVHPVFHPGKCARVLINDRQIGFIGELHPQVKGQYDLMDNPVLVGTLDLKYIIDQVPARHFAKDVSAFPPVLEDLAFVVNETLPATQVAALISQTGGKTVTDVKLFDVYRSDQIGTGKKSLAYNLTYQSPDRTLTDKDVGKIREKIVRRLEKELGAILRS
jgi:phenylalanyl-tRNA synthetase beta chain